MLPFDLIDRLILGIVVRAHRKSIAPDPLYSLLSEKDQRSARVLSSLVSVAEGLDSLHTSGVQGVKAQIDPQTITFIVQSVGDTSIEITRAQAASELLAETFGRTVVIR
jgi:exopolyphosphatase/pppGpp-phosphohydrolase